MHTRSGSCSTRIQGRHGDRPCKAVIRDGSEIGTWYSLAVEDVTAISESVRPREKHRTVEAGGQRGLLEGLEDIAVADPKLPHRGTDFDDGRDLVVERQSKLPAGRRQVAACALPKSSSGQRLAPALPVTPDGKFSAWRRRRSRGGVPFGPLPCLSASFKVPLGRTLCREERCG